MSAAGQVHGQGTPVHVELVSHASLLIRAGDVALLTDPWLTGTVFGGSWRLIQQPAIDDLPWPEVTHLWLSHNHPDHFHPASLSQIPEQHRSRISVLRSAARGREVQEKTLRDLGFVSFQPLRAGSWNALGGQVEVFEGAFDVADREDQGDAFLAVRSGPVNVLNLNDCVVRRSWQAQEVLRQIGADHVDLLCTQFSYGQWAGNPEDKALRRAKADRKLDRLMLQVDHLRARAVLPFASYFLFCHRENNHLNDEIVTPDRVIRRLQDRGVATVVLFPGERWTVGTAWDSRQSCAKWTHAYHDALNSETWLDDTPASVQEVRAAITAWNHSIEHRLGRSGRLAMRLCGQLPTTAVRLTDLRIAVEIVPGLKVREIPYERNCDVAMTSAAAARCFGSLRGPEEIRFGGRLLRDARSVDRFLRLSTTASLAASTQRSLPKAEARRIGRRAVALWHTLAATPLIRPGKDLR